VKYFALFRTTGCLVKLHTSGVKCPKASGIIIYPYSTKFALVILGLNRTVVFGESALGGGAAVREHETT
jgi:hypothetical protein